MISDNMLEHIRKSIEEGELFAAHVPVVKQLLESFDEQSATIIRLQSDNAELLLLRDMEHEHCRAARQEADNMRASRLAIVESLDAVMRERDLLKAQLSSELSGLVDVDLLMAAKKVQPCTKS